MGRGARLRLALGAAAPVGDFGLVDFVALVVGGGETGRRADGAVDIDHTAAFAADQMVVVVADPILEARGGPGRLNAPEKAFGDEDAERIVHRLQGDGPDLGPDGVGHAVRGDVRLACDDAQDGQSLGGDLNAMLTKQSRRVREHATE